MLDQNPVVGYVFGDSAYETCALTGLTLTLGAEPISKLTKRVVHKKLSAKAKLRKDRDGNHHRLYKKIRGIGEVLYGAATRAKLIHTNSMREDNRQKDALLVGLRQNLFTCLRLKALMIIIRKIP